MSCAALGVCKGRPGGRARPTMRYRSLPIIKRYCPRTDDRQMARLIHTLGAWSCLLGFHPVINSKTLRLAPSSYIPCVRYSNSQASHVRACPLHHAQLRAMYLEHGVEPLMSPGGPPFPP
ncbi:hypothetical protein BDZ97DRAFT_1357635 [Flammula alnicola]|nr:hypothetical protein BDZ97DRAFT_1357635 [Flammula alnicola]